MTADGVWKATSGSILRDRSGDPCHRLRAPHHGLLPAKSHLTDRVCRARGCAPWNPHQGPFTPAPGVPPRCRHARKTEGSPAVTAAGGESGRDRAWAGRAGCPCASVQSPSRSRMEWGAGERRGADRRLRAGAFLCSPSRILQIVRVAGARLWKRSSFWIQRFQSVRPEAGDIS